MAVYLGDGIYSIGKLERVWNTRSAVLADIVIAESDASAPSRRFGWIKGSIPTPATEGFYAVEFLEEDKVRVFAYIDMYGRAFSTQEGFEFPPAKADDLFIAADDDNTASGYVIVREGDKLTRVSRYVQERYGKNSRYSFADSWYNFGAHASNLDYYEFMTRAYFAFIYRTQVAGGTAPFGIEDVFYKLSTKPPAAAFKAIIDAAKAAVDDPELTVPPLVHRLAAELEEAGALTLSEGVGAAEPLRLVRTSNYANIFFIGYEDGEDNHDPTLAWSIEGALNRFLLGVEATDDDAVSLTDAQCFDLQRFLMGKAATQTPSTKLASGLSSPSPEGLWEVLSKISASFEHARMPYRIVARLALDNDIKRAALDVKVPSGAMMPASKFDASTNTWVPYTREERDDMAMRYALALGLMLVSIVFTEAPAVDIVDIVLRPAAKAAADEDAEHASAKREYAWCAAQFTREQYAQTDGFAEARKADPFKAYYEADANFSVPDADPFEALKSSPIYEAKKKNMHRGEVACAKGADAFGCDTRGGLSIYFDIAARETAEKIADAVALSANTTEAVKIVREHQEQAGSIEGREGEPYTRLMAALAEGKLDAHDQNAVVDLFLGEDECYLAYKRAHALEDEEKPEEAVTVLADALSSAALNDGFIDSTEVIYRNFDSYASRVIYNLIRAGKLDGPAAIRDDLGKEVCLVPDSMFMCLLAAADILEGSFERSEEALRYCERAITMGPTVGAGYRQLGRIHMLVGEMDHAATALKTGLGIMIQPNDIAGAYYQLAYVLWKSGQASLGAACYIKSIATAPFVANAASTELQELIEETGITLPEKDEIDGILAQAGIPVAPTTEILDALSAAAVVAVDEELFPVARNLLALTLRYRNDDALVNVLRYLEDL